MSQMFVQKRGKLTKRRIIQLSSLEGVADIVVVCDESNEVPEAFGAASPVISDEGVPEVDWRLAYADAYSLRGESRCSPYADPCDVDMTSSASSLSLSLKEVAAGDGNSTEAAAEVSLRMDAFVPARLEG